MSIYRDQYLLLTGNLNVVFLVGGRIMFIERRLRESHWRIGVLVIHGNTESWTFLGALGLCILRGQTVMTW